MSTAAAANSSQISVGIGDFAPLPVDSATVDEFFQLYTHFADDASETMLLETMLAASDDAGYCNKPGDVIHVTNGTDDVSVSQSTTRESSVRSHEDTTTPATVKSPYEEAPKTTPTFAKDNRIHIETPRSLRISDIIEPPLDHDHTDHSPAKSLSTTEHSEIEANNDKQSEAEENIDDAATESKVDEAEEQQRNDTPDNEQHEVTGAELHEVAIERESNGSRSDDDNGNDNTFEIESLRSHRVDEEFSVVDFLVEWKSGVTTWETERDLQLQVPSLVLSYWDDHGGRQEVTGLEEFHVLRLLDYRQKPSSYLVQWVGYRKTRRDTTWESAKKLQLIAPDLLIEFEANRAPKGRAKKRGVANRIEPARKRSRSS